MTCLPSSVRSRDLLLFRRLELVGCLRSRAQPLDRVHHVGLLRQHRIAELLRPVELVAHHAQHGRHGDERLHAGVPALLVQRRLQLVAGQSLVGARPAIGLHHLERIGRGHQDFGKQGVRIERDRREQLIELFGLEQRLGRSSRRRLGGGRLRCGGAGKSEYETCREQEKIHAVRIGCLPETKGSGSVSRAPRRYTIRVSPENALPLFLSSAVRYPHRITALAAGASRASRPGTRRRRFRLHTCRHPSSWFRTSGFRCSDKSSSAD